MKFKFPLQKVLEHRKIKENVAQKDFQDSVALLGEMNTKLICLEELVDDARARSFDVQNTGGKAGPSLQQMQNFIQNQKILIEMQRVKIQQQEVVVEEKRGILLKAAVETKAIVTFKEKKYEEFKKRTDSEEQKEMDEQSVLRFKSPEKRNESS
ncbi:MAG: flagellar export protein FliJ [Bdellovibrionaceae bacterium]|nr:flagellar export protein FliJ [Pseudobdellovibrionaceae bacterium]